MSSVRSENEQGIIRFQVIICGLPDSGHAEMLKYVSERHETFLPEMTAHIEKKIIPRGINYRGVEISGPSDPNLTSLAGAHALVFAASSDADLGGCRKILLEIHKLFIGRVPLLVLVNQAQRADCSLERPIELLGLADLVEVGISNLRVFSVCRKSGNGFHKALDWLISYFSTGDSDIGQRSSLRAAQ